VVNQVQREFNGLGQLISEYQETGAVNVSSSPKFEYVYTVLDSNNRSRITKSNYPSGFQVVYNYGAGLDSTISRLSSLSDTSGTLESHTYMGHGVMVE
jgi:YD repeat-containing protein